MSVVVHGKMPRRFLGQKFLIGVFNTTQHRAREEERTQCSDTKAFDKPSRIYKHTLHQLHVYIYNQIQIHV